MINKLIFVLLLVCLLTGCAKKVYSPYVANIPVTEEGTIFIRSSGKGGSQQQAYDNAVANAFNMLLYKGVPESIQSRPLIEDEATAKRQHAGTLNCFVDKQCYSQFITQANQAGSRSVVNGGTSVTAEVKINIRALRTYLEQKQVIRKFGF